MPAKYPHIKVKLSGENGNIFFILARVREAMRRAGLSDDAIEAFTKEAKSGDYDHLLQTVMKTVETS